MGGFVFKIKKLTDQILSVGNLKPGIIKTAVFINQNSLVAKIDDFNTDVSCKMTTYTLQKISDNKTVMEIKSTKLIFDEEILKTIKTAKKGDLYLIKDIQMNCPFEAVPRKLNPVVYFID